MLYSGAICLIASHSDLARIMLTAVVKTDCQSNFITIFPQQCGTI